MLLLKPSQFRRVNLALIKRYLSTASSWTKRSRGISRSKCSWADAAVVKVEATVYATMWAKGVFMVVGGFGEIFVGFFRVKLGDVNFEMVKLEDA
ncbi:hypothetical protein A2U01_0011336 [Trifolium medium]|uniref:Uncharacterized protein n=1 Tax=Trifolium medium TaxID=97028 RepID=A0A392MSC0_9FABA|nr:hypothetical protein [Trifolium medium]